MTEQWDPFEESDAVFWAELNDFLSIDENVIASESLSYKAIVHAIRWESEYADSDEVDGNGEEAEPPQTHRQAANILQQYLDSSENVDKSLFNCVQRLNDFLGYEKQKKCKRSIINAFL